MSTFRKELVYLILQFCNEEGFEQTARMLESESGFYFDMRYFEEMMRSGNWHEAERHLSGFTKLDDNRYSTKIYFEIRKQKFLETLDRKERAKALNMLMTDLYVLKHGNEELFKEMTQLLTLDDIRDHESLSLYGDTKSARETMKQEVKKLIEANPLFHGKLNFPTIKSQKLRRLINQRRYLMQATAKVRPELWQPKSGLQLMRNDLTGSTPGDAVPCFALSKNDSYLLSASGGIISLFNMITFKTMTTMMPPPPAATCSAFHPKDNNIIAIGMDNSTILIYNVQTKEVKAKLEGHMERVTGLAFSNILNLLISSGADEQVFTWNDDRWKMEKTRFLQVPYGKELEVRSDTHIQIHQDQLHFLAVRKTHLAIYGVQDLVCVKQWKISGTASPISHATFSCDGQTIYAGFLDGTIAIFDALVLEVQYQVHPSAYLPAISSPAYPVVVAAHPQEPAQLAVGLANGEVYVLEPLDPEGKWGIGLSVENMTENNRVGRQI